MGPVGTGGSMAGVGGQRGSTSTHVSHTSTRGQRGSVVAAGSLHVTLEGARGLRDADWLPGGGKSDPYAVVEIQGKRHSRFQTGVINDTLDPVWNVEGDVPGYEPGDNVVVSIFDKDPTKGDDLLGTVTLTTEQFAAGLVGEVKLDNAGKGVDAYVTLAIQPPMAAEITSFPQGGMRAATRTSGSSMGTYTAMPAGAGMMQQGGMMMQQAAPVGTYTNIPGQMMPTQMMMPGTTQFVAGGAMPMQNGMPMAAGMPLRGGLLKAGSITDDVFNMVDRNQDGVISRSEFRGALKGNVISASQTTRQVLGR